MSDSQDLPNCPKCESSYVYEDRGMLTCPECGHEWPADGKIGGENGEGGSSGKVIRDANGVELNDGDTVTVIKDLKVKGSSSVVKVGTKVKNIRLVEDDHDIDCKIPGVGAMGLKSMYVKKVTD